MSTDVWPTKATFAPGELVELVVTGTTPVDIEVSHLGEIIHSGHYTAGTMSLGAFDVGGYAVRVLDPHTAKAKAGTAFDVLDSPLRRPRYGFLSEFGVDRPDPSAAITGLRQLHLNLVQFYDWMYRHADLVCVEDEFTDTLGRRLSHSVARQLAVMTHAAGALPIGYAAVYGAGADYADAHPEQLLYHHDGKPWMLADFLWIANLDSDWRPHLLRQLEDTMDAIGFAGLHLDQYGAPKVARDAAGQPVDLATQFPSLIAEIRETLPGATLIFNNVNDFPTWATARAPQDLTYIEVWEPHAEYRHLTELINQARAHAPQRPVVLAAYLEPFVKDTPERAIWAARLALATVFAFGGHYLLCGEGDAVLTDPYYPNFRRATPAQYAVLRRYFDFAVANGDLLYDVAATTFTHSHFGGINDDIQLVSDTPTAGEPVAGRLWLTAVRNGSGLSLHVIDLSGQSELAWNTGKNPTAEREGVRLRVRWPGNSTSAFAGSPEAGPRLHPVPAIRAGDHIEIDVPPFTAWILVHLPNWPH